AALHVVIRTAVADHRSEAAVGAAQPELVLESLLRGKGLGDDLPPARAVVRVHAVQPARAELLLLFAPGVLEPCLVQVVAGSGGIGAPDQIGESREQRKIEVACALGLLAQLEPHRRVTGDDGKTAKIAGLVADRRDYVVAAIPAAVLAQMPAFLLVPAAPGRNGELLFRRLLAIGRVENGEMLAEDLGRRIAVQGLRARIPACNAALGVKHVYRAVLDGVNDQAGAAFAFAQFLLDVISPRDVADQPLVRPLEVPCIGAGSLEKVGGKR